MILLLLNKVKELLDWVNKLWDGIEFTFEWSENELNYLDVTLVMADGNLDTDRQCLLKR